MHGGIQAAAGGSRMAPAKTLARCGAGWVPRDEGVRLSNKAFLLMKQCS